MKLAKGKANEARVVNRMSRARVSVEAYYFPRFFVKPETARILLYMGQATDRSEYLRGSSETKNSEMIGKGLPLYSTIVYSTDVYG